MVSKTNTLSVEAFKNLNKVVGKKGRVIVDEKQLQKAFKETKPALLPEPIYSVVIGIDPDCNKSGAGLYDIFNKSLSLYELDLFDLTTYLKIQKDSGYNMFVRLEAGHLVAGTWHKGGAGMAKRVGANHEIGRQIEKFMKKHNIPYELVKPLGYSDYSHDMFCKVTGWPQDIKTNPEKRVGGLLAYQGKIH